MKTLTYSITINAPAEKVWCHLWQPENYKAWTSMFHEGSYYKTDSFSEGNKIHFLTPEGHGMYSLIHNIEENKYMSFKHMGEILDFKEQPAETAWGDAFETYTLKPTENGVQLTVTVDTDEKYIDMMNDMFPKALNELKRLCE